MFQYYFLLGVRSLRRNPALTALMVLTLAIGVAASVATLTILHVMSSNPIPHKSERLLLPVLDTAPLAGYKPGAAIRKNGAEQMSYIDSMNLLAGGRGERRTVLYGINVAIEPARKDLPVVSAEGLAATRDLFAMFDVPFLYGQPWSEADDMAGADKVVLSQAMAEKLFGAVDPVGRPVRLMGFDFIVTGVMKPWMPVPKFYRLIGGPGAFGKEDEFLLPFASAIRHETRHSGSMNCQQNRDAGWQGLLKSECTWMQVFFEVRPGGRAELQQYLDNYAEDQRKLGRMKRAAPNRLYDVMEWLEFQEVVGNDNRLSAWLAFAFLLLCLINTIGLLLAKFSVRASEVGIRRALGASRAEIFKQFLIETAVVGLAGGVLGLLLAFGALALIAMQSDQFKLLAQMDWQMLGLTFVMALGAALLAGLLPTWRACQVTPAIQLKSQ
ncbi:MAG: ABC transporter permease [Massilia sp.]